MKRVCLIFLSVAPMYLGALFLVACGVDPGYSGAAAWGSEVPIKPEALLDAIRALQHKYVRRSTGVFAQECETTADYELFKRDGVADRAAEEFVHNRNFPRLLDSISSLSEERRKALLLVAGRGALPTFAMVGRIPPDGSAQTEAGRDAELDIARAVVDIVEKRLAAEGEQQR
jgi:hypothetical protein